MRPRSSRQIVAAMLDEVPRCSSFGTGVLLMGIRARGCSHQERRAERYVRRPEPDHQPDRIRKQETAAGEEDGLERIEVAVVALVVIEDRTRAVEAPLPVHERSAGFSEH